MNHTAARRPAWVALLSFGLLLAAAALARSQESVPTLGERVDQLIRQLGDDNYFLREKAQQELIRIGPEAFDALTAALSHEDLEIAARAGYLVQVIEVEWARPSDPPDVKQLLSDYEQLDEAQRRAKMSTLAALPENKGVAALCRIARYEKSPLLSKHAALLVMGQPRDRETDWPQRQQAILDAIGPSKAAATQWLRNYVETHADAAATVAAVDKIAASEEAFLGRGSSQTNAEIVTTLLRMQMDMLEKLGRHEEARSVIVRIVNFEQGDPQTLPKLLDWLVEKQAHEAIDTVAERFAGLFRQNPELLKRLIEVRLEQEKPDLAATALEQALEANAQLLLQDPQLLHTLVKVRRAQGKLDLAEKAVEKLLEDNQGNDQIRPRLLYTLAEVKAAQEKTDEAEAHATQVRELNPDQQDQHYAMVRELRDRGLMDWSQAEYQRVIKIGPLTSVYTYVAQSSLAEMLHDNQQDLEAAKVLEPAVEELKKNAAYRADLERRGMRKLDALASRMLYFYASHYGQQQDHARQAEYLDKAIAEDPTDADVLIGLHRLPNQDDARKKKTKELIAAAVERFRQDIKENPDDATPYNQLAWLVGNTEGDQDEALRCSLRSLEIQPDAAGYLDTLGRCYYAQGDYENAVKHQSRAVELDPHSGLMRRQLELFKKALAEAKGK